MTYSFNRGNKRYAKENSTNQNSKQTIQNIIKRLDIVMYSSPTCFFCTQLKKMLQENNLKDSITIIEDSQQIPKEVEAFPFLKSRKTNKKIVGAPASIDKMIQELSD